MNTYRPKFLCEQFVYQELDNETVRKQRALAYKVNAYAESSNETGWFHTVVSTFRGGDEVSVDGGLERSTDSLKGFYLGMRETAGRSMRILFAGSESTSDNVTTDVVDDPPNTALTELSVAREARQRQILRELINEKKKFNEMRSIFTAMDTNGNGVIDVEEFVVAYSKIHAGLSVDELYSLFREGT